MATCTRWETFQRKIDELVARWTPDDEVLDVRDALLDLTTCPTCGGSPNLDVPRADQRDTDAVHPPPRVLTP